MRASSCLHLQKRTSTGWASYRFHSRCLDLFRGTASDSTVPSGTVPGIATVLVAIVERVQYAARRPVQSIVDFFEDTEFHIYGRSCWAVWRAYLIRRGLSLDLDLRASIRLPPAPCVVSPNRIILVSPLTDRRKFKLLACRLCCFCVMLREHTVVGHPFCSLLVAILHPSFQPPALVDTFLCDLDNT